MKVTRRTLLTGAAVTALSISHDAKAWWHGSPPLIQPGWQSVPIGDGGYLVGCSISAGGFAAGATVWTDTSGAYNWKNGQWNQLCNQTSLGLASAIDGPVDAAVWTAIGAPSNFDKLYMVYGDFDPGFIDVAPSLGKYAVYTSSDAGATMSATGLRFLVYGLWFAITDYTICNGSEYRITHQKLVIDPNNPNVAYFGIPVDSQLYGTYAGGLPSCWRTGDGGANWEVVPDVPVPTRGPGWAGMVIDGSQGTTTITINGVSCLVSNRIILPCHGQGVYISTNGGVSFSNQTSDPTPPTLLPTLTTANANDIIIVQVLAYANNRVSQVRNNVGGGDQATLTWKLRGSCLWSEGLYNAYEYWALAASAGEYNIEVDYYDGGTGYRVDPTTANWATATGCSISNGSGAAGNVLTVGTLTSVDDFAPGMELTGTGIPNGTLATLSNFYGNNIYIVENISGSGSGAKWEISLSTQYVASPGSYTGKPRAANKAGAFAVSNANTTWPFDTNAQGACYQTTVAGAIFDGYISGSILTVTTKVAGNVSFGLPISGPGVADNTWIGGQLTGTLFGAGTYQVYPPQTVGSSGSPVLMDTGPAKNVIQGSSTSTGITTRTANDLVFIFAGADAASADSAGTNIPACTLLNNDQIFNFWSEISTATVAAQKWELGTTVRADSFLNGPAIFMADALLDAGSNTIALDGTPVYATSEPASYLQPTIPYHAQVDHAGTYFCVNGPDNPFDSQPHSYGSVWRTTVAAPGTWDRLDGSNATAQNVAFGFGTPPAGAGYCVAVDPRSGHEGTVSVINGATFRGFQTANADAGTSVANITWVGSHNGNISPAAIIGHGSPLTPQNAAPWLDQNTTTKGVSSVGDCFIDPTNGDYFMSTGRGVFVMSPYRIDQTNFSVTGVNYAAGVEQMIVLDVCTPPGSGTVLAVMQDQMIQQLDMPYYPPAFTWRSGFDENGCQADYASDNNAFVFCYINGGASPVTTNCGFSNNFGNNGSWYSITNFPNNGTSLEPGGCCAVAAAGSSGSSSSNDTASVVVIPNILSSYPQYTNSNGATVSSFSATIDNGSGTGTPAGNVLTVTGSVTGIAIAVGMVLNVLNASSVLIQLSITALGTGSGGDGTYIVDRNEALTSQTFTCGWQNCAFSDSTTLPREFVGSQNYVTRLIAADRVANPNTGNFDTFYMYVPGATNTFTTGGLYISTDGGATFSPTNPSLTTNFGTVGGFYPSLYSVFGKRGHLLFCPGPFTTASTSNQTIFYSTDGGSNWANLSAAVTSTKFMGIGRAKAGNGYPVALLIYGIVSSISASPAFYVGDCNGADPSAGFTWTKLGDFTSIPSGASVTGDTNPLSGVWGDMNVYKRLYTGFGSANGLVMYSP